MRSDLRFALKLLWKEKAFSATALLTLALCIGANTAIFTVLKAVVLDPLPFPEPGRLVTIYNTYPGLGVERESNSVPDYLDRKELTDIFDSVALFGHSSYDVGAEGSPQRINGTYLTPSFFRVFRASAERGRVFTDDDAVLGNEKVVILSYGLWKELFAGDPRVLGQDLRLSGVPYRIVGVMPESFTRRLGASSRLWLPFAFTPRLKSDELRHSNHWEMVARLNPGVSLLQAQQRIDLLNRRNLERFPKLRKLLEEARFSTRVAPMKDDLVRDVRPTLLLLQGAVAFVLLIGCVNVANLMLVRSNIRMKELAIRFSLGAGRRRLARQLLTESVTLSALGGVLGMSAGAAVLRLLLSFGARDAPRGGNIQMDNGALAFSLGLALVTGLVFGSVPAVQLFRRDLHHVFRQSDRTGTAERGAMATRSALVVGQVSLAFVLLAGAGLLTLSFARLLAVDPGFQPQSVLTAQFSLPRVRYTDDARLRGFVDGLLANVRGLPGVVRAGAASYLPFGGASSSVLITIEGRAGAPGENPPAPGWNHVDTGYFQALGVPLLRGRTFTESDSADAPLVAVVDQFLARKYWPNGDAIGARIRRGIDHTDPICTVIGVVGSVKTGSLAETSPVGMVYFHYKQFPQRSMHLVVRTGQNEGQMTAALRRELQRADPELPLFDVKTMPERVRASLLHRRAAMTVCLMFAVLALALSAIGIYGVLAYTVTQRTREFGIRAALGAGSREVIGMVLGQGLRLAVLGLALGAAAALALTRVIAGMLYQVRPTDPRVYLVTAAVLAAVAAVASLIPSLRALRIHPAAALRHE